MSALTMAQVLWTAATLTDLRTSIVFLRDAAQSNEITSIQPTINQILVNYAVIKMISLNSCYTFLQLTG